MVITENSPKPHDRFLRRVLIGVAAVAGLGIFALTGANLFLTYGEVPSKTLAREKSPDGRMDAVLTLRQTSATVATPTAVYVTVRGLSSTFAPVFLADHVSQLRLSWQDARHLVIHARAARTFRQAKTTMVDLAEGSVSVSISYDIGAAAADQKPWDGVLAASKNEDVGNINFGAAGTAAGYPKWLLDRWAGWDQKKAETSRPEWGSPFGSAPYGDDPEGQVLINRGILSAQQRAP